MEGRMLAHRLTWDSYVTSACTFALARGDTATLDLA